MDASATLDEILERARHAQDAIRSLELARIEAHDLDELRKLDAVLVVLDRLAATATATATASAPADRASPAPADVAAHQPAGFSQRLGHVFVPGRADPFMRVAELPHREGLPAFEKCVAPDDSPINGAHGIFVTNSSVFSAVLPQPFASNGWQVLNVVRCDNPQTIIETVMSLLRKPDTGTLR